MTDVLYLMGHGYSGSTLLTFLLGSHPQIATIGELVEHHVIGNRMRRVAPLNRRYGYGAL